MSESNHLITSPGDLTLRGKLSVKLKDYESRIVTRVSSGIDPHALDRVYRLYKDCRDTCCKIAILNAVLKAGHDQLVSIDEVKDTLNEKLSGRLDPELWENACSVIMGYVDGSLPLS